MGIERFDDADDPSQEVSADVPRETDSPGGTGRSRESPQSDVASCPEEPTPDNPPAREPPERAAAEAKPAESRTRSEYADHVAPPESPPMEDDSPRHGAETPSRPEDDMRAATPSGQGLSEKPHSEEEHDEHADDHWDERELHTGNDSTAFSENQHSPGYTAIEPDRLENAAPRDEPEEPHDNVETDSDVGPVGETDDNSRYEPDNEDEPSTADELEGLPSEAKPSQETSRNDSPDPESTPFPEPNEESPGEGNIATDDPDQYTSETDKQTLPLTDREWAEHLSEVRDGLDWARHHKLQTHKLYTIDRDNREWSAHRNRLQGEIVSEIYERARDVPCGRQAIIAGGLGGAGKTTILTEHANIDLSNYLVVNPDDIKEEMARRGMIPQVIGLSPMEASDLAHEESSYIAKRLAMRAITEGKNLIWDITMSSEDSTKERINNLRSSGYGNIDGVFVHIPTDTSIRRIDARHREGYDMYRAGVGLGGRYVPEEVPRSQEDPEWGSQNRRTFERVKGSLDTWSIYDNSVDGRPPIRIESSPR